MRRARSGTIRQRPLSPPTPPGTGAPRALPTWRRTRRRVSRTGGGGRGGRRRHTLAAWPLKAGGVCQPRSRTATAAQRNSQQCEEPEARSDALHETQTVGQETVRSPSQWCVTLQRGSAPATRLTMADWATMATRTATRSHPTATAKDESATAMATVVHATASVNGHDS